VAIIRPFNALRPQAERAAQVAAVPYDVVSTEEARALASGNPWSFLHVSRPEIDLPEGTPIYSDQVYAKALANFEKLRKECPLETEETPSLYLYCLIMGNHEQIGVVACCSVDEYDRDVIRKHERTRRDKEDDRTRHMVALKAQTGPVFLTYRASADIDAIARRVVATNPLIDFAASDGIRHTLWKADAADRDALVGAFGRIPALYIADGHHRAASAARTRDEFKGAGESSTFLGVAFPHDQVQVLAYNRIVKDLGSSTPAAFEQAVRERFDMQDGPAMPAKRGDIAMYFGGRWQTLRPRLKPDEDAIRSLDVSMLQEQMLAAILGIADITTDKRIDFVGGKRGTAELERLVNSGKAAVAFSLYPVSVSDLIAVSDAGAIMPPKSTWFEPKLRDGLLIHLI
jgi:uncharacterized protein (DUF1015 family)